MGISFNVLNSIIIFAWFFNCCFSICFYADQVTVYDACEICHKKVFRQGDLTFHCEKCQKKWPSSKKRVIATVTVADHTDSCEVTFYHDMCVRMFGSQLETILGTENCSEQTYNIIRGLHFKRYLLKLNSTHTGGKTKNSVIALTPIDMKEYGQNLLNPTIE